MKVEVVQQFLLKIMREGKAEWRRNAATMKTRGFWIVNVMWFVAGGLFFQLLPQRDPSQDQVNYLLNQVLLVIAILPIYFSEVLTLSNLINRALGRVLKWINGLRQNNRV